MKRITEIQIENYRAFLGNYVIELPRGENILIYGENGSGKSSLFKALDNFLSSSRNPAFTFVKNHNKQTTEGLLNFTFGEYNNVSKAIISNYGEVISFGSQVVSTNTSTFLKDAELIKGFLDYRSLLEVYNHREPKPNLFKLLVIDLLKNYIPIGGAYAIGNRWLQLENNIGTAFSRRVNSYRNSIQDLPNFEATLRQTLTVIFQQLNVFLIRYFKLNLRVWFDLLPTTPIHNPRQKNSWKNCIKDLRLSLKVNGVLVGHQSDFLNEARLSALSICLYLAALKRNPQVLDYKVLFLDDVFIGLDTTNRLPILKIIQEQFDDYQVFISTYDRHLFELAKRKFESESPTKWKAVELYVGKDIIGNQSVELPILVNGESNFDRGSKYLHHRIKPDYPASANYFRKALEELIQDYLPKWETADAENTQIPDYQLTSLMLRGMRFLEKASSDSKDIASIISLLPALLHPLSHHEITSPIYKGELVSIEMHFRRLKQLLINLDILNNYKCCLESSKRLKMTFVINAPTNHYAYYELILKEPLTLKRNGTASPIVTKVHCVADKSYGINNTTPYPSYHPDKKNPNFNYDSLEDAYSRIYNHLITTPIGNFPSATNYLTTLEYHDGTSWQPLTNLIVW